MTGKRYYMTTLGDWQRHAARFANSHFIALDSHVVAADATDSPDSATQILVLIEADEGVHLALEDDTAFEPLPHPLAQKPISDAAQAALAAHGVAPGATTFDAAEAVARVHPLLRHRVFWRFLRTLLIREYMPDDLDALRRIHASQGFDYAFPDLADPIFVSKLVVEGDDGRIVMASLARLTCEMYLLVDRADESSGTNRGAGNPRERYTRLLALHRAGEQDLLARGLEDAHAWLPPPIAKRFGRRLEALGWVRDNAWTPYCKRLRSSD